jgi:hypothetical protein
MTTFLTANGLIEIPEVFRKADDLRAGVRCDIERMGEGEYRLKVTSVAPPKEKLVDVLRSCPVKDWWVEPDHKERTSLQAPALFAE